MVIYMVKLASILTFLLGFSNSILHGSCRYMQDSPGVIEKVYLHTDRDYYSPGDDIWFKVYMVNAFDNILSSDISNLHVELITPQSEIEDSRIVRIENGLGYGDFRLQDSLKSGSYLIRAYTNYMRNFKEPQFWVKKITITGIPEPVKVVSVSQEYISDSLIVNFFPEGGSLINDVTSIVGFKATNAIGSGCDVTGEVYSSSGERVASFSSLHQGMGKFALRPAEGFKYYALVSNQYGKTARFELPESFNNGIVLNVSDCESDERLITLRTNSLTLPQLIDKELLLTVSARNIILKTISFKISSLFTSFRLPSQDLPGGIIQLTLSGPGEIPLCERLIFHDKGDVRLEITTDKKLYDKRDPVSVKIILPGDQFFPNIAFLSLSAAEKIYYNDDPGTRSSISSWFLLESDIRGKVENPSYYFDPANDDRLKDLDLLLCTQGWRDFEWKYRYPEYLPENGFNITGRVEKLFSRKPLKNSIVTALIISDGNRLMLTSPTDSSGSFQFEGLDFTGNVKIIASVTDDKEKLQGYLILNDYNYPPAEITNHELSSEYLIQDQARENAISNIEKDYEIKSSIIKKYTLSDTIMLGGVEIFSRQKNETQINYQTQRIAVGIPDNIIKMTPQLQKKSDFRDILIGRVAGLTISYQSASLLQSDNEPSGIRIRGSTLEPLFLLDGFKVEWVEIKSLPLSWIDRIEILKSGGIATTMYAEGQNQYNGVISVITKPHDERKEENNPVFHSVNKTISGFNAPRIFYSPDYSADSEDAVRPDLRSTLFWKPDIVASDNDAIVLKYFNADNTGKITIIIEGITSSGIPVTAKAEYTIE
jgi:hypothetical protein